MVAGSSSRGAHPEGCLSGTRWLVRPPRGFPRTRCLIGPRSARRVISRIRAVGGTDEKVPELAQSVESTPSSKLQRNAGFVYRELDFRLSGLSVSRERPIHRTDEGKHRALRFSERNGSLPKKGHFRSVTLRLTFRLVLGGPQDHLLLPICNIDARTDPGLADGARRDPPGGRARCRRLLPPDGDRPLPSHDHE